MFLEAFDAAWTRWQPTATARWWGAQATHAFLAQPFSIAELWTNTLGEYVPLAWALDGLEAVLAGNTDDADEALLRTIAGTHLYIQR